MVYHRKLPSHVVTPGSYERTEKDDRVYYYPEMAARAHCGKAFTIHLDVADSDFLVLVVNYHRKPGHDAAEYWHHIPWEQVDDLVIGNHD